MSVHGRLELSKDVWLSKLSPKIIGGAKLKIFVVVSDVGTMKAIEKRVTINS